MHSSDFRVEISTSNSSLPPPSRSHALMTPQAVQNGSYIKFCTNRKYIPLHSNADLAANDGDDIQITGLLFKNTGTCQLGYKSVLRVTARCHCYMSLSTLLQELVRRFTTPETRKHLVRGQNWHKDC